MTEQKTKTAIKKVASGKPSGVTAVKPKAPKVTATVAIKKTATKKSAAPVAKKIAAASGKTATKKMTARPTPEERYRMVQTAAYFIAERNAFGGCSTDHWAAAEVEIARRLGQ